MNSGIKRAARSNLRVGSPLHTRRPGGVSGGEPQSTPDFPSLLLGGLSFDLNLDTLLWQHTAAAALLRFVQICFPLPRFALLCSASFRFIYLNLRPR